MDAAGSGPAVDVVALQAALEAAVAENARINAINADLAARNALLELQLEKMRRERFGQSAERGRLLVDQMELGTSKNPWRCVGGDDSLWLEVSDAAGGIVWAFGPAEAVVGGW